MWTHENRSLYERKGALYPSDLSDAEWALISPLIPLAKRGGRRCEVDVREVMNGVLYVLETGCQWRAMPKDLPPKSTVHDYLILWDWDGIRQKGHRIIGGRRVRTLKEWRPAALHVDMFNVHTLQHLGWWPVVLYQQHAGP